jgi:hypothetical protein
MDWSGGPGRQYDARTMRSFNSYSFALFGSAALLLLPVGAHAQSSATASSPTLAVTRSPGGETIGLSGDAAPNGRLSVALYARFSRDLPTVLLSRREITADAAGHYTATLPIAPAFFRGAIVTAIVQPPSGASAQASVLVTEPNVPAPPDDTPASVR